MHITTIDVLIRTLDSEGAPTSSEELYGIVRNSRGECVRVLEVGDLTETATGVYELSDFDVRDSVLYPGIELTIFWCTKSALTSPETALQRYTLYADHPSGVLRRLVTWTPSYKKAKLYGYQILRKLPTDEDYVEIGRSIYPYFFDRTEYASAAEFNGSQWQVRELVWIDPEQTEPIPGAERSNVNITETRHDFCEVYGEVVDIMAGASTDRVAFFVHEIDAPQTHATAFLLRRNEVYAPVNHRGEFSIPLLCGALVTLELPDAGKFGRFIVPSRPHALLRDLEFFPIDTHRI